MAETENESVPKDWRARIKEQGKSAFEMDEMRRLGFWPPTEGLRAEVETAEREVARLDREIAPLRRELSEIEAEIAKTADVQSALDEIRAKRIERVKAEREANGANAVKLRPRNAPNCGETNVPMSRSFWVTAFRRA